MPFFNNGNDLLRSMMADFKDIPFGELVKDVFSAIEIAKLFLNQDKIIVRHIQRYEENNNERINYDINYTCNKISVKVSNPFYEWVIYTTNNEFYHFVVSIKKNSKIDYDSCYFIHSRDNYEIKNITGIASYKKESVSKNIITEEELIDLLKEAMEKL